MIGKNNWADMVGFVATFSFKSGSVFKRRPSEADKVLMSCSGSSSAWMMDDVSSAISENVESTSMDHTVAGDVEKVISSKAVTNIV